MPGGWGADPDGMLTLAVNASTVVNMQVEQLRWGGRS